MDCKYFINESGKFVAKRLPYLPSCAVKIKDVSDISMLRCDLADYQPSLDCQFIELYERNFDTPYSYDIEIETFEETVQRNRNKFLEDYSWLKKWHEDIAYHLDENPDEEWQYLDEDLSRILIKSNLATGKEDIDDDDLSFALNRHLLVYLKEIARPAGIKVAQKKKALINDIIKYHNNNGKNFIEKPLFIRLSPSFVETLDSLKQKYILQIDDALKSFPYPDNFKAAVWDEVCHSHEDIIYELARDKIRELGNELDSWYMSNSRHQQNYQTESKPIETTVSINSSSNNYLPNAELVWKDAPIAVSFGYRNYSGDESYRTVNVSQILVDKDKGVFYLYGFCNKRGELRHFRHLSINTKLDINGRKLTFNDWLENELGLEVDDILYCTRISSNNQGTSDDYSNNQLVYTTKNSSIEFSFQSPKKRIQKSTANKSHFQKNDDLKSKLERVAAVSNCHTVNKHKAFEFLKNFAFFNDEELQALCVAQLESTWRSSLVLLTDRRILFVRPNIIESIKKVEILLDKIEFMDYNKGMLAAKLIIKMNNGESFSCIGDKKQLKYLYDTYQLNLINS